MRRFLVDDAPATYSSQTEMACSEETNFLPQEVSLVFSREKKQPKGKSALSYQSWGESSTGEMSVYSFASGELMMAVGAQFTLGGDSGSRVWEGGYPMTMSGVSGLSGN